MRLARRDALAAGAVIAALAFVPTMGLSGGLPEIEALYRQREAEQRVRDAGLADCAEKVRALTTEGSVARGERFARPLPGGLAFELRPWLEGWVIWIGEPGRPEENYAAVATPPFHGPNPMVIQGWHFRNADNTGPNGFGPNNVNAPQQSRGFRFVLDKAHFDEAMATLAISLWPGERSAAEVEGARQAYRAIDKAQGTLRITDLELGNLVPGERAWIERAHFVLHLCQPPR
jgi:hypothetical protein